MTVLTFPSNPVEGQRYNAPNEVQYVFDGAKWIVDSTNSSSEAVTDSVQDRVAPMFVGGDNEGISFTYDEITNVMSATVTSTVPSNSLVNGLRSLTLEANGNITAPAFTIPNTAGTSGQVLKWPGSGSTLVWGSDNNTGVALPTNAAGVLTNNGSGTLSWVVPTAQVQSNWNATSGLGVILNKPTIPTSFDRLVNGIHSVDLDNNGRTDFPNNVYIQNKTIGQDDTESTLNLYSAYGMDLSTAGGPMRLEVGAAFYGPGENITILAGAGGEPGFDSSNGGNLYISAGHAGFNETGPGPTGGSVYISAGNAADGVAGDVHIQGGEGDGTTPGSVFVTSGNATEWEFKADKSLTFPTGGQIANYPGGVGASNNSWFVTPGNDGNGGVSSQDGQQYIQINNNLPVEIGTSYGTENESIWRFGTNGSLTFPDGESSIYTLDPATSGGINGIAINGKDRTYIGIQNEAFGYGWDFRAFGLSDYSTTLKPAIKFPGSGWLQEDYTDIMNDNVPLQLGSQGSITLTARLNGMSPTAYNWVFGRDGSLTFPDNTVQTTAWLGVSTAAIDDTAPSLANGSLWFNTIEGRLYIKYSDLWIDAAPLMMPAQQPDINLTSITFADATVQTTAWTGVGGGTFTNSVIQEGINSNDEPVTSITGLANAGISLTSDRWAQIMWVPDATNVSINDINAGPDVYNWAYVDDIGFNVETDDGIDNYKWEFNKDGTTQFPNGTVKAPPGDNTIIIQSENGKTDIDVGNSAVTITLEDTTAYTWTYGTNGVLTLPSDNYLETSDNNLKVGSQGSVTIRSNAATLGGTKAWAFGTDGELELPTNGYTEAVIKQLNATALVLFAQSVGGNVKLLAGSTSAGSAKQWLFNGTNGRTTFPVATVPEHSYGATGDKAGMVAFDTTYIYYCTADYVNNTTDIWKRTAHGAGTW